MGWKGMGLFGLGGGKRQGRGGRACPDQLIEKNECKIENILKGHERRFAPDGESEKPANLSCHRLHKRSFQNRTQLRKLIARGVELHDAEFSNSDLSEADFSGADLSGSKFIRCNLDQTIFYEAKLKNTVFFRNKNLLAKQFGGADVTGAKLPDGIKTFDGLKTVFNLVGHAGVLYAWLLTACVYSLLVIATTTDQALVTNAATDPLPIVGTKVPIAWVYRVAPWVILGMFIYFQVYMQRTWEALAQLPAVFPDGRSLISRARRWMPLGLISKHWEHLKNKDRKVIRLQNLIVGFLAYLLVPIIMMLMWFRYLTKLDAIHTYIHVMLVAIAFAAVVCFPRCRKWTFARSAKTICHGMCWFFGCFVVGGLLFFFVSYGVIYGVRPDAANVIVPGSSVQNEKIIGEVCRDDLRRLVPRVLGEIYYNPYANLFAKEISKKPGRLGENKNVDYELISSENGWYWIDLKRVKLRNADLFGAFLAMAYMPNADLKNANLKNADLRGANLSAADLRYANLQGAGLHYADLRNADLRKADLRSAVLYGATLRGADLREAVLWETDLTGSDLTKAGLRDASLQRADLRGSLLWEALTCEQIETARILNSQFSPRMQKACKKEIQASEERERKRMAEEAAKKKKAAAEQVNSD